MPEVFAFSLGCTRLYCQRVMERATWGGVILSEEVMIPPVIETGKTVSNIQYLEFLWHFFLEKER